jgi:hypothetical protein
MTQIAYLLLCHKDPEEIIIRATRLTAAGDCVAIHFDARARPDDYQRISQALAGNPAVAFVRRRIKCGWGEWSLVEATLEAARAAVEAFPGATHFYLLSGDCMPIKTAEHIRAWLDREDADFIESLDYFESDWIKTGIKAERLIYRHWFNERRRKRLFYASMNLQAFLGLERALPAGLKMRIGSQWWCLRRRTITAILDFAAQRRDVVRFFSTTWIPDETFFQTVVAHLVPEAEIRSRTLTFLLFTDYGMPATFCDDHHDFLLAQDFLFARKISPDATLLKDRLGALYAETGRSFVAGGDGKRQFEFLTGRGRHGRRFAQRFWETGTSLGRNRTLMLVACKKWHVAKRLVDSVRAVAGVPAVGYLFNENATDLPDLGGIQYSLVKRMRHRRAVVGMLFDAFDRDRLVLCVDPSSTELIRDLYADRAEVRLLEIDCDFSDDYLIGHARRVGLTGTASDDVALARLLPTLRHDLKYETDRLRDLELSGHCRILEAAGPDENAGPLAEFLGISLEQARAIAASDHLFAD